MKLILKRSQRQAGMLGNKVAFALDARIELTQDERADINRYRLGDEVVYNSEERKRRLQLAADHAGAAAEYSNFSAWRSLNSMSKSLVNGAMAALQLKCTINSLAQGQHIECKDLPELLGAEEAIKEACENTLTYLQVAATFDGREEVIQL